MHSMWDIALNKAHEYCSNQKASWKVRTETLQTGIERKVEFDEENAVANAYTQVVLALALMLSIT